MAAREYLMGSCWTDEGDLAALSFERDEVVYSVYEADQPDLFQIEKFTSRTSTVLGVCSLGLLKHILP